MKRGKKYLIFLLVMVLALGSVLSGCSNSNKIEDNNEVVKETESEKENVSDVKTIEDMAGREIEVPTKIEKVYATALTGTLLMYSFDEEKLCGININLTDDEKKYTSEHFQSLPVIGATAGKGQVASPEEIMSISPDIILSMGRIDDGSISEMDKLQETLEIPVIMVDGDIRKTSETYKFLGELFDDSERANELIEYTEKIFDDVNEIVEKIPEDERVKTYYASGPAGLETGLKGSGHTETIEISGGENVAEGPKEEAKGRTEVSMEQVLEWDPELIIVAPSKSSGVQSCYELIKTDENWQSIGAVKNGKVYETPYMPFNWFDKPPAINRLIGIKWLTYIMYPDKVNYDIKEEAKQFYDVFYHIKLTDEDLNAILENSI